MQNKIYAILQCSKEETQFDLYAIYPNENKEIKFTKEKMPEDFQPKNIWIFCCDESIPNEKFRVRFRFSKKEEKKSDFFEKEGDFYQTNETTYLFQMKIIFKKSWISKSIGKNIEDPTESLLIFSTYLMMNEKASLHTLLGRFLNFYHHKENALDSPFILNIIGLYSSYIKKENVSPELILDLICLLKLVNISKLKSKVQVFFKRINFHIQKLSVCFFNQIKSGTESLDLFFLDGGTKMFSFLHKYDEETFNNLLNVFLEAESKRNNQLLTNFVKNISEKFTQEGKISSLVCSKLRKFWDIGSHPIPIFCLLTTTSQSELQFDLFLTFSENQKAKKYPFAKRKIVVQSDKCAWLLYIYYGKQISYKIEYKCYEGSGSTNTDLTERKIQDSPFLFDLKVKDKTIISETHPFLYLLGFGNYFLSQPDINYNLFKRFINEFSNVYGQDDSNGGLDLVVKELSFKPVKDFAIKAKTALVLLGLLPINGKLYNGKWINSGTIVYQLMPCFSEKYFNFIMKIGPNNENEREKKLFCRGIGIVHYLDHFIHYEKQNKNQFLKSLERMKHYQNYYEEILRIVVELFSSAEIVQNEPIYQFLKKESKVYPDLKERLISITSSLVEKLENCLEYMQYRVKHNLDNTKMPEIINNKIAKSASQLDIKSISEILQIYKGKHNEVKSIFLQSNIKQKMEDYLKRKNYDRKLLIREVILQPQFDEIFDNFNKAEILNTWINNTNSIDFDVDTCLALFQIFTRLTPKQRDDYESKLIRKISTMKEGLKLMQDLTKKNIVINLRKFWRQMHINNNERNIRKFIELAKSIPEKGSKKFLESFEKYVGEEIIEKGKKDIEKSSENNVYQILNDLYKQNKLPCFQRLINPCLHHIREPNPINVIEFIIKPIDVSDSWYLLLNDTKNNKEKRIKLINEIESFIIENLQNKALSIRKGELISHFSNEEKRILIQVLNVANKDSEKMILKIIETSRNILKEYENLMTFLNFYGNYFDDQEMKDNLKNTYDNFDNYSIKDFQFSGQLQPYLKLSKNVNKLGRSKAFHQALKKCLGRNNLNSNEFYQSLTGIFNNFTGIIKEILNDISQASLKSLLSLFDFIEKSQNQQELVTKEIKILQKFLNLKNSNTIAQTNKVFDFLAKKSDIVSSISNMMRISEMFKFDLNYCKSIKSTYESNTDNLCSVKQFVEISENTWSELSSGLENNDIGQFLKLMEVIADSKELMDFLIDRNEEIISHMKDSVTEFDDTEIAAKSVQNLSKIKSFFSLIRNSKSLNDLKVQINKIWREKEFEKIDSLLKEANSQVTIIKDLYMKLTNKEEAKKKQMENILQNSSFNYENQKSKWIVKVIYFVETTKRYKELTHRNVIELKDRAILIFNTVENMQNEEGKFLNNFIELIVLSQRVLSNLENLDKYGFPFQERNNFILLCKNGSYDDMKITEEHLTNLFSTWKETYKSKYRTNNAFSHLFGRQWIIFEEFFLSSYQKRSSEAIAFLNFMNKYYSPLKKFQREGEPAERLHKLLLFLDSIPSVERKKISRKPENFGKVIILESPKMKDGIITLYMNDITEKTLPNILLSQILFCEYDTPWLEIKSFIFRCFLNKINDMFILVYPDKLSNELQGKFEILVKKLQKEKLNENKFRLGILLSHHTTNISYFFQLENYSKFISSHSIISEVDAKELITEIDNSMTTVITSEQAGLGKTQFVYFKAKQLNKQLKKLMLTGEISLPEIGEDLQNLGIQSKSVLLLQIDSVEPKNDEVLEKLLFQLIYCKGFNYSVGHFYLPKDISVFIEISNQATSNCKRVMNLLNGIQKEHIRDFQKERINTESDEIQHICQYLLNLEKNQLELFNIAVQSKVHLQHNLCVDLLKKYFIGQQNEISFSQLNVFIKVLDHELKGFKNSPFIPEVLQDWKNLNIPELKDIFSYVRTTMVNEIIRTTNQFSVRSVGNVKAMQKQALEQIKYIKEQEDHQNHQNDFLNFGSEIIKWENKNHFFIIMNEDGECIPIYKDYNSIPQQFTKFLRFYMNFPQVVRNERNLNNIVAELTVKVNNPESIFNYSKANEIELKNLFKKFNQKYNSTEKSNYVVTTDNFLKMMLIYTRVKAKIPVVIVGETGCGKTSLIRYLANEIFQEIMITINIHAGITKKKLNSKMEKVIEETKKQEMENKQLWVFFDEFNTSEVVGIINDIVCHRNFQNKKVPNNLVFVAACNPYRMKSKNDSSFGENVGIRMEKNQSDEYKLLYLVRPLPETMLDYVWDFGSLVESDEKKYIDSILRYNLKREKSMSAENINKFIPMIFKSHRYFKIFEDASSVSLRDVQRFKLLFKFFREGIQIKNPNYQTTKKCPFEYRAAILALLHCYYLRLGNNEDRKHYLNAIGFDDEKSRLILQILDEEQIDIIKRMEIPKLIAYNKSLKENVLAILACIMTDIPIPIFICGKPGCSKTLAINLIQSNLREKHSNDEYFKRLPKIQMFFFQGSEASTSKGVLDVFRKAKTTYSNMSEIKSVIVIDEIGLAELSPHNPLKVLHNELEIEKLEKTKVGFVGISNWRLDASKMNRALYLARPDPDLEEVTFTANFICKRVVGFSDISQKQIMKALSYSYFYLKKNLEGIYSNFYGLRDFYHLVKMTASEFRNQKSDEMELMMAVVKRAIQRNFGGSQVIGTDVVRIIEEQFLKNYGYMSSFIEIPRNTSSYLIEDNLSSPDVRYLMIISEGDEGSYILDNLPEFKGKQYVQIVGSYFEENNDNYRLKSLSDVISCMEKGQSIILKNMEHIYSSLYDLFNQSFTVIEEKKYCRIAYGALYNPKCLVDENFHCIIYLDSHEVFGVDAPFLNRFEKHCLRLDDVLSDYQKNMVKNVRNWMKCLTGIGDDTKKKIPIQRIFPYFQAGSIDFLILQKNHKELDQDEIERETKKQLIKEASSDFLVANKINNLNDDEKESAYYNYLITHNNSFEAIINRDKEIDNLQQNSIVLTFSKQVPHKIRAQKQFYCKILENYKKEEDLRRDFEYFFKKSPASTILIEIDLLNDWKNLSFVKSQVDKYMPSKKFIILILQVSRNQFLPSNYQQTYFIGWNSFFIDELDKELLSENDQLMSIDEFLEMDTYELLSSTDERIVNFLNIQNDFISLIERTFLTFKYCILQNIIQEKNSVNVYIRETIDQISKDPQLKDILRNKIRETLENGKHLLEDWKFRMLMNENILSITRTPLEAARQALIIQIQNILTNVIFAIESHAAFPSFWSEKNEEEIHKIWSNIFMERVSLGRTFRLRNVLQSIQIPFGFHLEFPFSDLEYEFLERLVEDFEMNENLISIKNKYLERTLLKDNMKIMKSEEYLEKLYVGDILQLFIVKNSFPDKIIWPIVELMIESFELNEIGDLIKFILYFISHQEQISQICYFILNIQNIISINEGSISKIVREVKNCLKEHDQEERSQKKDKPTEKIILQTINNILIIAVPTGDNINNEKYTLKQLNLYFKNLLINVGQLIKTYTAEDHEDDVLSSNIQNIQLLKYLIEIISQNEPEENHPDLINILHSEYMKGLQEELFNPKNPFQQFIENYIEFLLKRTKPERKCINELISYRIAKLIDKSPKNLKECFRTLQKYDIIDKISTRFGYSIVQYLMFQESQSNINPDKNDFELLPDNYGFVENIEQCLKDREIKDKFGCFLNDFIQKILYLQLKPYCYRKFREKKEKFVQDNINKFMMYFEVANNKLISDFEVTKITLSKAFMSFYLNIFCEQIVLYKNSKGSEPYFKPMNQIIIKDEHLSREMLKYCASYLREHLQMTDNHYNKWINDYSDRLPFLQKLIVETEKALSYFPISTSVNMNNWFIKCLEVLSKAVVSPISFENIKEIILKASESTEKKFNFLIAFIIQVYILHTSSRKNYRLLERWVEQSKELIVENFGMEEFDFMDFLLNKSSISGFLKLKENALESEVHMKIMIASFISLMIVSKNNANCLTYLFFDHGIYRKNLVETINRNYIVAANKDMILESNMDLYIALKAMAPNESATLHMCSKTCDYLFVANECGWPTDNNLRCPFDSADLSAPGHRWARKINPPISLSPLQGPYFYGKAGQSAKLAEKQIQKRKQKQPRGFGTLEKIKSEKDGRFREMDGVAFRILRIFSFSWINYLLEIKNIGGEDVFSFLPTEDYNVNYNKEFTSLLEEDINYLNKILNTPDSFKWVYGLFPILLNFLLSNKIAPTNAENRDNFENEFNQIINRFTGKKEEIINFYMERFSEINGKIKWSNPLEKSNYFRNIKLATEADLLSSSKLAEKHNERASLMNLINLSHNLNQVQYLWPIVEFSKYMLEKFNYSISRSEAYEKEIKNYFNDDPTLISLFEKFCEAWEKSNFGSFVQFECKKLKNPKRFNEDMIVGMFLIDSANDGCGSILLGGIISLIKSHNSLISAFAEEYAKKMEIEKEAVLGKQKVFFNSISRKDCIHKALEREKLATKYYLNDMNNPQIINMDWKTIENKISELYLNKKILDDNIDNIQTIKYQGEQFSTAIFEDISSKIRQSPLDPAMQKQIIYSHIFKTKSQIQNNLKQILSSFEKIFCFLTNEMLDENSSIQDALIRIHLSNITPLLQKDPLGNMELKYILDIFAFFEKQYFDRIRKNIPSFDISPERIDQKITAKIAQLSKAIEKDEFPSFQEVQNALIKLFMRSNLQNLKQDDYLIRYLNRSDLWEEKWDLDFHIYDKFGEELTVSNFYEFYYEIDKKINGNSHEAESSPKIHSPSIRKGLSSNRAKNTPSMKKPGQIKI